jgi:alpha-glucoside transport system permease protein
VIDARYPGVVGLANYVSVLTEPFMLVFPQQAYVARLRGRAAVVFCLLVATLADRSRHERLVKAIIFTPVAISRGRRRLA